MLYDISVLPLRNAMSCSCVRTSWVVFWQNKRGIVVISRRRNSCRASLNCGIYFVDKRFHVPDITTPMTVRPQLIGTFLGLNNLARDKL